MRIHPIPSAVRLAAATLAIVMLVRLGATSSAVGQGAWTEDQDLGVPGEAAYYPLLVPDPQGGLHMLFVGSAVEPDAGRVVSPALYYRYWDGSVWSEARDVVTAAAGRTFIPGSSGGPSAVMGADRRMHITWANGAGQLLYTSAWADDAATARAWAETRVLTEDAKAITSLTTEAADRLHLIYDRNAPDEGVSYMRSPDNGATWSDASDVSGPVEENETVGSVTLARDERGWLHVGWDQRRIPGGWPPIAAKYARSEDGGATWTEPEIIDTTDSGAFTANYGPAFTRVVVDTAGGVHLFWMGRPQGRRYHRLSLDGGRTWSQPEPIFGSLTGRYNGGVTAVSDGAGAVHAVTGDGVYVQYSQWRGGQWSAPVAVESYVPERETDPHFPSLAITNGNLLHLARHIGIAPDDPITVLYARRTIDAPFVVPASPQPVATGEATRPSAVSPTDALTDTSPADTEDDRPATVPVVPRRQVNPYMGVAAGVLPAAAIVVLVAAVHAMRRRNRR